MVRSRHGTMVPLGSVVAIKQISNPLVLTRYNMYPAAALNGSASCRNSDGESAPITTASCSIVLTFENKAALA